MSKGWKIFFILAFTAYVGAVITLKQNSTFCPFSFKKAYTDANSVQDKDANAPLLTAEQSKPLPHLVDLGADKCIPCKLMAPILEELKKEYAGRMRVDFFDVWKKPSIGNEYGIRVIPTQIFYDASGRELFRHEGFFSKEDILAKWREFGIDIEKKQE